MASGCRNRALQERGLFLGGSAPGESAVCLSWPQADKVQACRRWSHAKRDFLQQERRAATQTDQAKKGTARTRGWHPEETASTLPQQVAQKPWGEHSSCDRPADYLLRGLWVSGLLSPGNGGMSKKGRHPRTDQAKKGADSKLQGWQPKEKAT